MQNPGNSSKSNVKSAIAAILVLYLFFPAAVTKGDWESDANARIEQIRKRDVQITAVDPNGSPVSDLDVQIDQIYHRFGFGAALAPSPLDPSIGDDDYKNFVRDHFEWAVAENAMKWDSTEQDRDNENYTQADKIANWCANNDIILRGHCVLWEQNNDQMPSWVPGLDCYAYDEENPSEMQEEIDERINSIVDRYKGQIASWDIDNEMLSDNTFGCLGEAGRAHFFQLANSIDPNCGMYMNEYRGNSFGGYDGDEYVDRANGLIALGAPVEGLGIQAHINSPFQPENYYNNVLQELAVLGLPIIATEFDTNAGTATQVADDLEDFYRICFSHADVEGIMMWGFTESAWRWSGIVNSSTWTLNAAGVRYEELMDEWTTEDSNITDLSGNVNFRGFQGTYEITLSAPGEPAEIYVIELEPGETAAEFVFETDLESPEPDFNSPDPDPMTWASEPTAIGSSRITMTATTATDERPPVEYYFECITDGDANSGWQTDKTYVAQDLNPLTLYTFMVKARDSAPARNETDWSTEKSATTESPPPGPGLKIGTVSGVGSSWEDVTLKQSYSSMVVVAAANYDNTSDPVVVRIQNASGNSFQVRVDAAGGTVPSGIDVHYMVAEEGVYTAAEHGVKMEAVKYLSTVTDCASSWVGESRTYSNSYSSPVVLGQVMTYTDPKFSSFWCRGSVTGNPPDSSNLYTGKTICEDPNTTCNDETIGYIVIEAGSGDIEGINYVADLGSNAIAGVGDSPPYTYSISGLSSANVAIASCAGMNGPNGGWAILYGADPLTSTSLNLAIDEDVAGDTERDHISEEVGYIVFEYTTYQNCAEVQAAGFSLVPDLDGDCYVDYRDFEIIAYYWLNTDCDALENCEGADFVPTDGVVDFFDYSDFAKGWLQCNDPEDPNCTPNWEM